MSRETSAGAGKLYGLERVCRVLEFPRSTLYAQQARDSAMVVPLRPQRRGPKPTMPDADLLAAIRADLEASLFSGEGHRKVWARLRILRGIRVSRARVLRLMRENALLSPYRRPQGAPNLHDGSIQTDRPNEMWGTDGIRIETVDEGWVWVFAAVDHFDACCVGIHAVKTGNRFAALQPIAQGLWAEFGATGADARTRPEPAHGPRHAIYGRRLPQPGEVLGYRPELRLRRRATDQRCGRTLQPDAEGAGHSRARLPKCGRGQSCRHGVQGPIQSSLASGKTGLPVTPRSPSGLCHEKGGLSCKTVSR